MKKINILSTFRKKYVIIWLKGSDLFFSQEHSLKQYKEEYKMSNFNAVKSISRLSLKQKLAIYILGASNVLSALICIIAAILVNSPQNYYSIASRLSVNIDLISAIGAIGEIKAIVALETAAVLYAALYLPFLQ